LRIRLRQSGAANSEGSLSLPRSHGNECVGGGQTAANPRPECKSPWRATIPLATTARSATPIGAPQLRFGVPQSQGLILRSQVLSFQVSPYYNVSADSITVPLLRRKVRLGELFSGAIRRGVQATAETTTAKASLGFRSRSQEQGREESELVVWSGHIPGAFFRCCTTLAVEFGGPGHRGDGTKISETLTTGTGNQVRLPSEAAYLNNHLSEDMPESTDFSKRGIR